MFLQTSKDLLAVVGSQVRVCFIINHFLKSFKPHVFSHVLMDDHFGLIWGILQIIIWLVFKGL